MLAFPHIEAIHNVAKYVDKTNGDESCPNQYKILTPVKYRGTVKLHGTNAGIGCFPDRLIPQSRSRVISVGSDNDGFALFLAGTVQIEAIRKIENDIRIRHGIPDTDAVYLYGEWCGKGIQKGVSICDLPYKHLVLFSVRISGPTRDEFIDALTPFGDKYADARIFSILDVPSWELIVDFSDPASKQNAIEKATELTNQVETNCPWGAKFGLTGVGEGIVWVPVGEHWGRKDLWFKTKGEKHKGTKSKRATPSMEPEILSGIAEFVEFSTTENRLEQGLQVLKERGLSLEMKFVGEFLKWVLQDIARECAAELAASGLEWKQVQGKITDKAKTFFRNHLG